MKKQQNISTKRYPYLLLFLIILLVFAIPACDSGSTNGPSPESGNEAPTASINADATEVEVGETVQLDGSDSSDPDGDDLTFNWSFTSKPGGSEATLSDANTENASFTADISGDYEVELMVSDETASDTDMTVVTANPAAAPLICAEIDRNAPDVELRNISADSTMANIYRVPTGLRPRISGNIRIEAGTIFILERDAAIWFEGAGVFAQGEADRPVLFCGDSETAGFWKEIRFRLDEANTSRLSHVRIEDGGGQSTPMVYISYGALVMESVALHNSGDVGLLTPTLGVGTSDLTITGSARHPLELTGPSAINNLPEGNYTGNGEDIVHVSGFSNSAVTFTDRGIPYLQTEESIAFAGDNSSSATVTFKEGVEYRFSEDADMVVGWRNDPAEIQVEGTENNPVVFTSYRADNGPQPGDWNGIRIEGGTRSSSIQYASFHYGGKTAGNRSRGPYGNLVVTLEGAIDVQNTAFTDSGGAGISINDLRGITINGVQCGDPSPTRDDLLSAARGTNTFENNAEGDVTIIFPSPGDQPCPN